MESGIASHVYPAAQRGECLLFNPYVPSAWINVQIKFHKNKKYKEGRSRKRQVSCSSNDGGSGHAAPGSDVAGKPWENPEGFEWLQKASESGPAFIALLFPAIAASLAGTEAHREHLRLEKRSANMAPQLNKLLGLNS